MYNIIDYIKDTLWCLLLLFELVLVFGRGRRGLRLVLTIGYIIYNVYFERRKSFE